MFVDQGYDSGNVIALSPAQFPMGLPEDTQSTEPPPGFRSTLASISPPPKISTAESIWSTIKQDSQSALAWTEKEAQSVYQGSKNVISTVYHDVAEGVGTVAYDATAPVRATYWYLILGLVVVAGGLYFIGKTGAIKVSV
jgi:hypothetical protein